MAQTKQPGTTTTTRARGPAKPAPRLTRQQRAGLGLAARALVEPQSHAELPISLDRPEPVAVLEKQGESRVAELVPLRYGRMLVSPFTFYRGAAAVMAADLASSPVSGFMAQLCGDAHLSNFGAFASPERRLVFDINDFDETHPGPWEWDVKRLTASLVVAGRANNFSLKQTRSIVRSAVRRYQRAMADFARMSELDIWYAKIDVDQVQQYLTKPMSKEVRKSLAKQESKARLRDSMQAYKKLTHLVDGRPRIMAMPPLLVPLQDLLPETERQAFEDRFHSLLGRYRRSLPSDRRVLFERFTLADVARKVVGVGSVGTRCWIALFFGADENEPFFLQVKEAQPSVLAPYSRAAGLPVFRNQGERVVAGQRLMQATSDIFLGWEAMEGIDGQYRDFYMRQLRDWKGAAEIERMIPEGMAAYAEICAWTLARAHARSGDAVAVSAYLGEDGAFADAIARFSELYADQNDRDFTALTEARRSGRISVEEG